MNNPIKYKYAWDNDRHIVEISTVNKQLRNNTQYYCISCGKELIPRLGDKNQHHFAHKSSDDTISCKNETYLHELAKIKIKEIFDRSDTFIIKLHKNIICSSVKTCEFSQGAKTCCEQQEKIVNLKSYYDTCTIEKQIGNFKADILLENSTRPIKPLLIEICVTHPCSEEKINSKLPIIEIPVSSEDDIKEIEMNTELKGDKYNITLKDAYKPLEIEYPVQKYALFSSGKYHNEDCYKTTCKEITMPQYKQALLEISVYNQHFDNNYFLLYAQSLGYNIKDCSICQHYKYIQNWYSSYPLCMQYKKHHTPKSPHFLYAYRCPYYTINRSFYQEYKSCVTESQIKVITNNPNAFNNLSFESLYLQHINRMLTTSIETLSKYFKHQKLWLRTEKSDINLAEYYDSSKCSKENELVYYLRLYHSRKTNRPPLLIYCIEGNCSYDTQSTSAKSICLKIKKETDIQYFIAENGMILCACHIISFHNILLKAPTKTNIELHNTEISINNEEPHFPKDYKENILSLLEKEFTSKTIFIERFDPKRLDLKSLFNHCTISEEKGTKMLKLYNNDNQAYSPLYIQPCFRYDSPQQRIPTIILRLDMNEKWKNISYQGCLLLIEGPSGGFYNIKDLFEQT